MKNSDMPAMPTPTDMAYFAQETPGIAGSGLTKREYFAGLAMQAIVSGALSDGQKLKYEDVARGAALQADALLNQLQATEDGDE